MMTTFRMVVCVKQQGITWGTPLPAPNRGGSEDCRLPMGIHAFRSGSTPNAVYNGVMRFGRVLVKSLFLCLPCAMLTSCYSHHVAIARKGGSTTQKLLVADEQTLIDSIARQYNAVRDFAATVDMAALVGSSEKNQLVEYKDVRAYIYFRRPSDLHLVGLYPVVRTTAFDMVSTGNDFRLYVPRDNS